MLGSINPFTVQLFYIKILDYFFGDKNHNSLQQASITESQNSTLAIM